MTKAASGGELSRVMLALEVATATEVTGADVRLRRGGCRRRRPGGARGGCPAGRAGPHAQVIVVTHLAQVAAYADRHLVVERADDGHITRSGVHEVDGDARVAELARMLGGSWTDAALEHARELLARARV